MVRTFLADWVPLQKSTEHNWCPTLPTNTLEFSIKQHIMLTGGTMDRASRDLWIWELQSALQERIAKMDKTDKDLPASLELIALFILSYPGCITHQNDFYLDSSSYSESSESFSIVSHYHPEDVLHAKDSVNHYQPRDVGVSRTNERVNLTIEKPNYEVEHNRKHLLGFEVPIAPQDIQVSIQIYENDKNDEKKVELVLITSDASTRFHWQDWINSIMGYLKGIDETMAANNNNNAEEKNTVESGP